MEPGRSETSLAQNYSEPFPTLSWDLPRDYQFIDLVAVLDGAKAAYQNICQSCHGQKGDGKGAIAPTLRTKPKEFGKLTNKSEEHLFKVIKEGGVAVKLSPMMPAFGTQLKDDEVREMVRYVLALGQPKK